MNNLRHYLSQLRLRFLKWELRNSIGTARIAEKDAKALREKIEEFENVALNAECMNVRFLDKVRRAKND